MTNGGTNSLMVTLRRIGVWFGCLLFSVTLFSLLFSYLNSGSGSFQAEIVLFIFRVTMIFAFPIWCLYLPVVIALKDAEGRRIWIILFSGTLIGPISMALWSFILQLRGDDPHVVWYGDPLVGLGGVASMVFASIVGFLTTSFYVIALKFFHRRSMAARIV